jgi:hypothetical protein
MARIGEQLDDRSAVLPTKQCACKTCTNANAPRGTLAIATAIGSWPALPPYFWPWSSSRQRTGSWAPPTG